MNKSLYDKYCPSALKKQFHFLKHAIKRIRMGQLNRLSPFSQRFGYDRGGPIDRVYIEAFLSRQAEHIKGTVLEIADNSYTLRFGGERVSRSEVLHIDADHQGATITGDLVELPSRYNEQFDCIILTQTLHLIYDFKGALQTCRRLLKPKGVLLLTVPGITQIDQGDWGKFFLYSFTTNLFEKLRSDLFPSDQMEIYNYGNVKTAAAFLYGLGQAEISPSSYAYHDQHYQVIIAVKLTRCEN